MYLDIIVDVLLFDQDHSMVGVNMPPEPDMLRELIDLAAVVNRSEVIQKDVLFLLGLCQRLPKFEPLSAVLMQERQQFRDIIQNLDKPHATDGDDLVNDLSIGQSEDESEIFYDGFKFVEGGCYFLLEVVCQQFKELVYDAHVAVLVVVFDCYDEGARIGILFVVVDPFWLGRLLQTAKIAEHFELFEGELARGIVNQGVYSAF